MLRSPPSGLPYKILNAIFPAHHTPYFIATTIIKSKK
jgi:hypothetical protein